jgi:hypothetical protein
MARWCAGSGVRGEPFRRLPGVTEDRHRRSDLGRDAVPVGQAGHEGVDPSPLDRAERGEAAHRDPRYAATDLGGQLREPGRAAGDRLGRGHRRKPGVRVAYRPAQHGVGAGAADPDRRYRGARRQRYPVAVEHGGLARDQAGQQGQRPVGEPAALGVPHSGGVPAVHAVHRPAGTDAEHHPVAGEPLHRTDLLGRPGHRPQRQDHHAVPEPDPFGGGGDAGQQHRAVVVGACGDQVVADERGIEADRLRVPRAVDQLAERPVGGSADDHADLKGAHIGLLRQSAGSCRGWRGSRSPRAPRPHDPAGTSARRWAPAGRRRPRPARCGPARAAARDRVARSRATRP